MYLQLRAAAGFTLLIGLAWLISTDRRRFPVKVVATGLLLQYVLALIVLRTDYGAAFFGWIGHLVATLIDATNEGSRFVFGKLVDAKGPWGFVFATRALPAIIVFSSLSAIGYHYGILQKVVAAMAWVMTRAMGVSGAESLSAAANVFMGQTEAPLFIRPYIPRMTNSELNAIMVGGFATIAGSLMAAYASILGHEDREAVSEMARHLLTASLISAPAGLVVAKIIVPETARPETAGHVRLKLERTTRNVIDAAATGALDGLKLALNVGAMLIAFIALITLVDIFLIWLGGARIGDQPILEPLLRRIGIEKLTLDSVLGLLFWPVSAILGIEPDDRRNFASLLGKAMAINEFVAYTSLDRMIQESVLSPRSVTLAIYCLCGFANFSSIAIQIAGIGGMAPDRYHDLARLGLRAMLGGAIACWMTACVAGTLLQ
jgi:CNT family concentrative nucleoside transporter